MGNHVQPPVSQKGRQLLPMLRIFHRLRGTGDRSKEGGSCHQVSSSLAVPEEVLVAAVFLHGEGYRWSEAYPLQLWRRKGWREDAAFHAAVDACIDLMRKIEKLQK